MSSAAEIARALALQGVASHVAAGCAIRRGKDLRVDQGGDVSAYFDLASLTKPMTALALARSGLPLDSTLGGAVPELGASATADASILALLSHRAGLLAHVPLFLPLTLGRPMDVHEALRRAADARRPDCLGAVPKEGFAAVYSDLGYILAGVALARHLNRRDAGECVEELVSAPLGRRHELGTARSVEALGLKVESCAAPTEDIAWRGGVVRGRVHDENAWALTGEGGSGHAGMFGTLGGVLAFGSAVLDAVSGRGPFADADVAELLRERLGISGSPGQACGSSRTRGSSSSCLPIGFIHRGTTSAYAPLAPPRTRR